MIEGYVDAVVIVNLNRKVNSPCPKAHRGAIDSHRRTGCTRKDCIWAMFYALRALMARVHQSCHQYIEPVDCIFHNC